MCYLGEKDISDRWIWKMDYCKKKGIPPAREWAWNQAEKAYRAEFPDQQKPQSSENHE